MRSAYHQKIIKYIGVTLVAFTLTALGAIVPVAAQNYPVKPIRILAPFVAGGPTDAQARWAAGIPQE